MISKTMTMAVAAMAVLMATGCVVRTGEDARSPRRDNNSRSSSSRNNNATRNNPKTGTVARDNDNNANPKRGSVARNPAAPTPTTPANTDPNKSVRNEGWKKLGEATANGRNDHDVVSINQSDSYRAIRFKVASSSVKMADVVVYFTDGTKFSPSTATTLTEGTTTSTIDLPGGRRTIKSVNFRYSDGSGTGSGVVEVWGI